MCLVKERKRKEKERKEIEKTKKERKRPRPNITPLLRLYVPDNRRIRGGEEEKGT